MQFGQKSYINIHIFITRTINVSLFFNEISYHMGMI